MTELDALRSFRAYVAPPAPIVRTRSRDALLDVVRAPGARSRPFPRRLAPALGAVAVLGAVALAAVSLIGGSPGIVEQAQAAIDPQGRILHVVVTIESSEGTSVGESWIRPDGTGRTISRGAGVASDCLAGETELRCYDAARDVIDVYRYNPEAVEAGRRYAELPGFRVDQPESIHRAFGSGYARLVGEAEIAGRPVYEFRLAVPFVDANGVASQRFDDEASPILYLDRETLHPVAERFPDAESTTYYETYEFLPSGAMAPGLLELPAGAGTEIIVHPVGEGPRG
jgi:hypothetical protein